MQIIIALLIFSAIILFHELGHFLLAKLNRVVVLEFSLGMGPRLLSWQGKETRYSLKVLPFGGSCMMLGEDMEDLSEGTFGSKSVWGRISIIAAGPLFNFLLAYLLSVALLGTAGIDESVILSVSEGYPAQAAGLMEGDIITNLDGHRIICYRDILAYCESHQDRMAGGEAISVAYTRGGERLVTELVPADNGTGRYVLGISGSTSARTPVGWKAFGYGFHEVGYWIRSVLSGLRMMFTGQAGLEDLSGPVGVVEVIGETYTEAREDGLLYIIWNMMNIAVLLSANLGVVNLLPLPALDGGRLLFLLAEAVRGRRINQELEGKIHLAGLMLLMALMVIVLFSDVRKIFMR